MKKIFFIPFLFLGCTHLSEMKHESGQVVEKQYFPDIRQTVTGTGFSSNGSIVITQHQIGDHEKFVVIFKCEHGVVFSVNRNDIYSSLEKGDKVQIDYFEILNGDNEIVDLDFYSAEKL